MRREIRHSTPDLCAGGAALGTAGRGGGALLPRAGRRAGERGVLSGRPAAARVRVARARGWGDRRAFRTYRQAPPRALRHLPGARGALLLAEGADPRIRESAGLTPTLDRP